MKTIIIVLSAWVFVLLAGCGENPVSPSTPPPAPAPTVSQANTRALELHGQGLDAVAASRTLKSEYTFGVDTLTAALYSAGYTPQELVSALKVVFVEMPRACERIIRRLDVRITQDETGEYILTIYADSLLQHPEDLVYFVQTLQSTERAVSILTSFYKMAAPEIIRLLHSVRPDIHGIVIAVHKCHPAVTEKDYAAIMSQLKVLATDAARTLKDISTQSAATIAGVLEDAGYGIVDICKALHSSYALEYAQIAAILDQLGYSLGEVLDILKTAGCTIDALTGILKDHYSQSAAQAAMHLKQLHADFSAIADGLKNHYTLTFVEIAQILKDLGGQIADIAPILKRWESLLDVIRDLITIGFPKSEVYGILGIPFYH